MAASSRVTTSLIDVIKDEAALWARAGALGLRFRTLGLVLTNYDEKSLSYLKYISDYRIFILLSLS